MDTMKGCGCAGSETIQFEDIADRETEDSTGRIESQLRQWPIQLHLISPSAPYYQGADVLLTADCVGYALGDFHREFLKGKAIAIACPKLDDGLEVYEGKIKAWFEEAKINTLTVVIMQVPCCMGLMGLVNQAVEASKRKVPVKLVIAGAQGEILSEELV